MEREDLVTVYTVKSAAEAEIVSSALKQVGITAIVSGEGQAGLAGVLEIEIMTKEEDASQARKYLRKIRKEKKERIAKQREAKKVNSATPPSDAIQELDSTKIKKRRI